MSSTDQPYRPDLNIRLVCRECLPALERRNRRNEALYQKLMSEGKHAEANAIVRNQPYRPNIVEETANGDLVCGDCGLVLSDRVVDTRSEWRTFANDDGPDQSRVGDAKVGLDGVEDFSTEINFRDGQTGMAKRLNRAQRGVHGAQRMEHLNEGFRVIQELSDKMSLNKRLADTAKQIYMKVEAGRVEKTISLPKGPKSLLCLIGTCIYIAGKQQQGSGRSMKEISAVLGLGKMELANVWKAVWEFVKADMHEGNGFMDRPTDTHTENSASIELARRYCDILTLPLKIQECAAECIERCGFVEGGAIIDGRSPVSIAGGAIHFACILHGNSTSPKQIMEIAQVSESTIRTIARLLGKLRDVLITPGMIEKGADKSRLSE